MSRPLTLWAASLALALAALPAAAGPKARREPARAFRDGEVEFIQVLLSPDGKLVAARGADNLVRLWDFKTGKLLRRVGDRARHPCDLPLVFTGDGKALLVPVDVHAKDGVRVVSHRLSWWDVREGKRVRTLEGKETFFSQACVNSPDGKAMLTRGAEGESALYFRDPHTGKKLSSIDPPRPGGYYAFTRDGKRLLLVCRGDEVWSWDLKARKGTLLVKQSAKVFEMGEPVVSPDGESLAIPHHDGVALFSRKTGKLLWACPNKGQMVRSGGLAFALGGKWVLSLQGGVVVVVDAKTGAYRFMAATTFRPDVRIRSMAVTPDGRWLLTAASAKAGVEAWDLDAW